MERIIVGIDPALANTGIVMIDRDTLQLIDAAVISTETGKRKFDIAAFDLHRRGQEMLNAIVEFVDRNIFKKTYVTELSVGGKSYLATSRAACAIGVLSFLDKPVLCAPQSVKSTIGRYVSRAEIKRASAHHRGKNKTKVGSMLFVQKLRYDISFVRPPGMRNHVADAIAVVATHYDAEFGRGAFGKRRMETFS